MQGVVFDEMEKFVHSQLGDSGLSRVRSLTDRSAGYEIGATYPDEELAAIVSALVDQSGRRPEELIEAFGFAMVPGLLNVYGFLVNPRWSFVDFLLNVEGVIHRGVKLNTPSAQPPALECERMGRESVRITYRSERRLCPLAKGIVRGAAMHYGVEVMISEEQCMLRGDPQCLITISERN
jgi:Haem-NO-binding